MPSQLLALLPKIFHSLSGTNCFPKSSLSLLQLLGTATNSPGDTDTVAWFLDNLKMPIPSSNDFFLAAIYDLKTALSRATTCHPSLLHSSQLHHIPTITE